MNSLRLFAMTVACAALATPFASAAAPADSTLSCATTPSQNLAERRVSAEAAKGMPSLIRFVHRTQPIYQLDVVDAVAMIDRDRERRAACTTASAGALSD